MTAVWVVIVIVGIIAMVATPFVDDCINITNSGMISFISGLVMFITGAICFFAVPITGYMEVKSTHWRWTIDVYTYQEVQKSGKTGNWYFREDARSDAIDHIPSNANEDSVKIEVRRKSKTVTDREYTDSNGRKQKDTHTEIYYYADYSYTVNEWVKTSEVNAIGDDKNPHEPDKPYPVDVPDVLGNKKCASYYNEYYTVTGDVNGETKTYEINKQDWEKIGNNDEFAYTKFRFGKEIWNLQIAQ